MMMRKLVLTGIVVCAAFTALLAGAPQTSTMLSGLMPHGGADQREYTPGHGISHLKPFDVPAPVPLADFSSRAALQAPELALAEVPAAENTEGASTALRLTTQGSTVYTIAPSAALATPVDVRNGYTILPFKPISNCEKALRWSLEFHSEGSPGAPTGNYHEMDAVRDGPSALRSVLTSQKDSTGEGRWEYFGVHTNNLHAVGTGANLEAIKFVRLIVRGGASPMVIELGSPYFQRSALNKAKAIITFDDGYASVVNTALPLFKAKGFRGMYNLGAMQQTLDAPGHLTKAQVHVLRDAGWQWMQQAYSTEELAPILAMSETDRDAEMRKQIDFARENRLGDPGFGSYFSQVGQTQVGLYGMFARNQRSTRAYFTPRAVSPPDFPILYGENYPFVDPYLVKSLAADVPSESFGLLTQHAEQAIANRGVAIYTFHNALDNLPMLLDWLDANRDRIDVVTEADLFTAQRAAAKRR
ncbi:hypothetical protein C1T17_17465 [Sphingobium sp. SCG-1]|uniref:hypothetical protein n=1 Tax=Sphingobium sp. SCG-1 TaxID=2072936 RepID=UPI000CD6BEF0|nr:hypothetical protein [Sphingobium sp. SCG-1]AUW59603.1 hypothetical protein C1T17_17465 [Sphingobium sp. SCG-1]